MLKFRISRKRSIAASFVAVALLLFSGCAVLAPPAAVEVETEEAGRVEIGIDELFDASPFERAQLLTSVDRSLQFLTSKRAAKMYSEPKIAGFRRERVIQSLRRFRELAAHSADSAALWDAVKQEFTLYRVSGQTGQGDVRFTGYFQPLYSGSRTKTGEFRYPLYRLPRTFKNWPKPHPSRCELEGEDGKTASEVLRGLELIYLRDRLDAFLVHVQGSARVQLSDNTIIGLQFAGATDHPYTSIGKEIANDGHMTPKQVSIPSIRNFFNKRPDDLDDYLCRNDRFVFFKESRDLEAMGCLSIPVTPNRSIATDKALLPPGALALIRTKLPYVKPSGKMGERTVSRYVLDQDSGTAIRGPGSVDVFMGYGEEAGARAGRTSSIGELYYLLLRPDGGN